MKLLSAIYPDQKRVVADVEARIAALFARCPALCGFAVQDRASLPARLTEQSIPDADLYVTEIGIFPRLDEEQFAELYDEITTALSALVNEQPNAFDVLRGRTFARALQ
ncbi:MAG TPA: hypothetical protein VK043_14530 [Burkholderiales bacterium]|nr:hypothetical protein [Burkholderiales bacterium]